MAGNEELLARLAGATLSINTGAPRGRCRLCRYCVAADLSAWPNVELITDTEFEAQLDAIVQRPPTGNRRIWFGYLEPLAHPRLCEFVEATVRTFPTSRVFVVTSGLPLTPERAERLSSMPEVDIGIAVNTLDPDVRTQLYGAPARANIDHALTHLPRVGVAITDCGSVELVERDLDEIARLRGGRPASPLLIRRLEHTRFSPPDIVRLSEASIASLPRSIERVLDRVDVYSTTDFDSILRFGPEKSEIDGGLLPPGYPAAVHESIRESLARGIVFCAAPGSFSYWQRELAPYGDAVAVVRTENTAFGGSLECAGLMTVADAFRAADGWTGRVVFLPKLMFGDLDQDVLGFRIDDLPAHCRVV
jgi:hypothetical protein